ncbi:MAG: alpha/beta fold hydrolase [Elainellaceae cyanobacterium]
MTLPIRNSRIRLSHGQIFWREVGQGDTLIFLHGTWTDGSQWVPVIQSLSQFYHCIALDLLGFGESEWTKRHYSIALEVECLAEFIDALKLRDVYLVGHSIGGWVAASYALRCPLQVKGLILLHPEGVAPPEMRDRWRQARWLTGNPPLIYWIARSLLPLARLVGAQVPIQRAIAHRKKLRRSPTACRLLFKRRRAEIREELLDNQLEHLRTPMLLLQGEHDQSECAVLTQAYAIAPNAKLYSISDGEGDVLEQMPNDVAGYIREFCSR